MKTFTRNSRHSLTLEKICDRNPKVKWYGYSNGCHEVRLADGYCWAGYKTIREHTVADVKVCLKHISVEVAGLYDDSEERAINELVDRVTKSW